jgi:hypothetical protein
VHFHPTETKAKSTTRRPFMFSFFVIALAIGKIAAAIIREKYSVFNGQKLRSCFFLPLRRLPRRWR